MSFQNKVLWLDNDCIFVALQDNPNEEPKMVIVDHKKGVHYAPKNDSAKEILNLLVKKGDKGMGIHYKDLKKSMLNLFDLTDPDADNHLANFLNKLDNFGILASKDEAQSNVPAAKKKPQKDKWDGDVIAGGTLCCLGYNVTYYYWP